MNGVNFRTAMYDYEKTAAAARKFNEEYSSELEYYAGSFTYPGKVMEILGYKLYAWPGHGLSPDATGIQFLEAEYMKPEEYDDLIRDPSDFWLRTYMPRVFEAFVPFSAFGPATDIVESVSVNNLMPLGNPAMQETLKKMLEAGEEYQRMMNAAAASGLSGLAAGFPVTFGTFAKAPFDTLGDTLRGTAGVMKDMYRRPDKVLEACDKIADLTIHSILSAPNTSRIFSVTYPLHKGADGWMSQKQFETFYWPSLKKIMDAFIKEGLIQTLFAEGSFNTRMEAVNVFPKGFVQWWFDQSDMEKAKAILGQKCCIQGNVPSSLMVTGSASDVKSYCRRLIETCGKGGGYILGAGCVADNPKLENLRAMVATAKEYGTYRK
jgi:uroporphyrinogen-III decarboxylase